MYCQFENRYIMTEDMIREYLCQIVCKRLINVCIALFAIFALACGATWYLGIYYAAAAFGVFAITSIGAFKTPPLVAARQSFCPVTLEIQSETVVQFGDRILVRDCGVDMWFDYNEITGVTILNHFSVLQVGRREAIILTPTGFSRGDRFTFWRFFRSKRPDLWAKTAA